MAHQDSARESSEKSATAVLYVPIPRAWHDRLKLMAEEYATTISGVVRILIRDALFGKAE